MPSDCLPGKKASTFFSFIFIGALKAPVKGSVKIAPEDRSVCFDYHMIAFAIYLPVQIFEGAYCFHLRHRSGPALLSFFLPRSLPFPN